MLLVMLIVVKQEARGVERAESITNSWSGTCTGPRAVSHAVYGHRESIETTGSSVFHILSNGTQLNMV